MKKKILSLILTLAMLLSLASVMSTAAIAAETDADTDTGTATDTAQEVLEIASYTDLENFIASLANFDYADKTVTVTQSITVNSGWTANDKTNAATAAPTGENAKILDTTVATNAFAGTFKGANADIVISGLYINGDAFFPSIAGATIQDITFDNCYISLPEGYDYNTSSNAALSGIIAARATGTEIFSDVAVSNSKISYAKSTNTKNNGYFGLFVGHATTSSQLSFTNCVSEDNYIYSSCKTSLVGGFAGNVQSSTATFYACTNTSSIKVQPTETSGLNNGFKSGGFVGVFQSGTKLTLTNCVNSGDINSFSMAAGFVGDAAKALEIKSCINAANITAGETVLSDFGNNKNIAEVHAGGMIGRINGTDVVIDNSVNKGAIYSYNKHSYTENSASKSKILGNAGGIVAYSNGKAFTITNCINSGNIGGLSAGGVLGKSTGAATISDSVNIGELKGVNQSGGIVGLYEVASGTFTRVINSGTIKSAQNGCNQGGIIGRWNKTNTDDSVFVQFTDVYYANSYVYTAGTDVKQAIGIYVSGGNNANVGKSGNYKYTYTTVSGEAGSGTILASANTSTTAATYMDFYNKPFKDNGYFVLDQVKGELGADKFVGFAIGEKYVLTDTVPMPIEAHKLMNKDAELNEAINLKGYQVKLNESLLSEVRLVADVTVDLKAYQKVGFKMALVEKLATPDAEPTYDAALVTKTVEDNTVYTSLNTYSSLGELTDPVTAVENGYLSAVTVTGLPTEGTFTYVVTPFITDMDNKVTYGASYAFVVTDGVAAYIYAM